MHSLWALLNATPETFSGAWHQVVSGTKDVEAALDTVHKQVLAINKLRAEPVGKTEEEQLAHAKALVDAYGVLADTTKKAMGVVETQAPKSNDLIEKLSGTVVSATAAQKDFGLEAENVHKRVQAATLEQADMIAAASKKSITIAESEAMSKIKIWEASAKKQAALQVDSAEALLKIDQETADKEYQLKLQSLEKERAAEQRAGRVVAVREINAQIEALNADHAVKQEQEWQAQHKKEIADLQESERLKIDATKQGAQARLAAIDAAIKEEQAKNLQDTPFYKSLLAQRLKEVEAELDAELKAVNKAASDKLKLRLRWR